jgi:TolB-like protein/DNA-binding winged helix-turn-helix (wHTH) protein/Tfp pilus assembly protein PilF
MHEQDDQPSRVHFGVFEADLRRGELRKRGLKLKLHGQPFQILAMLLKRPGELVRREEIRERLWPRNTFVDFEHSVNTSIKRLREVLGDNATSPRFIETLPRQGYRFIAPVEILGSELHFNTSSETLFAPDSENPSAEAGVASALSNGENGPPELSGNARDHTVPETAESQQRRLKRAWISLLATVAVAGLLAVLLAGRLRDSLSSRLAPPPRSESIAVLPLENLSHDSEQDYFADGMTEELITNLGKIGALRVVSRTSVMHYKGTKKTLPEIAKELNVEALVEGTVLRTGNRVRITANLLNAKTDRHIWAESYERDLRDVLSLQDELARTIAGEIKIKLTAQEMARLSGSPAVSPEAYRLYLQARYHCYKRTLPGFERSIQLFQQALAEDPGYASAYAGLAECYGLLPFYGGGSSRDVFPKAKAAALKAVELNDSLAEAHAALGFVLFYGDWDWTGAERELRRAIELNPSYPTSHHWYAEYLSSMGRHDEAVAEVRHAEELDPLSALLLAIGAEIYTNSRRYDECIDDSKKALELDPNFAVAHENLAGCLLQKKLYKEAGAEYMEAGRIWGSTDSEVMVLGYALSGRRADAIRTLERSKADLDFPARTSIIQARICLGANLCTKEETLGLLEKAYREHEAYMPFLNVHPAFDPLRSDSRFEDLIRRMRFPNDDR